MRKYVKIQRSVFVIMTCILLTRGSKNGSVLQPLNESVFILLDWSLFSVPTVSGGTLA